MSLQIFAKKTLTYSIAISLSFIGNALGQTDVCRVALESNAFNTFDQRISSRIAFERKEELCSRDYESSEEFRNEARSSGFSLSYAGVGIGASGGRAAGSGRVHFREEAFCQSSQEAFSQDYESNTSVRIGDVALQAWSECVRETNENSLWLNYTVSDAGSGMTGTLQRTVRSGRTTLRVTSMQVHPDTLSDQVRCSLAGRTFTSRSLVTEGPIETETTSEIISCTKPVDVSVEVGFGTDGGSLEWVVMPSAREVEITSVESLQQQNSLLMRRIDELGRQVAVLQERSFGALLRSEEFESTQGRTISINLTRPALMIASAHGRANIQLAEGQTGRRNGQLRTRVLLDGRICAGDYVYFSPVSRIRFDVSGTCVRYLAAGSHNVEFQIDQNSMDAVRLIGSLHVIDTQQQ